MHSTIDKLELKFLSKIDSMTPIIPAHCGSGHTSSIKVQRFLNVGNSSLFATTTPIVWSSSSRS